MKCLSALWSVALLCLVACSPARSESGDAAQQPISTPGGPQPTALLLALHGLGGSGGEIAGLWGLSAVTDTVVLTPTGSLNAEQRNSWNASTACCNDLAAPPDDISRLVALVQSQIAAHNVDPRYVFVAGDSNGGFMTWRLICTHPELFTAAAIVSGGANAAHDPPCTPSQHVPILAVHGTEDPVIPYGAPKNIVTAMKDDALPPLGPGGSFAQEAAFNGCTGSQRLVAGFAYDHDVGLYGAARINNFGAETDILAFDGCPTDGAVEAWRMMGSAHDITWSPSWPTDVMAWLRAHHRE